MDITNIINQIGDPESLNGWRLTAGSILVAAIHLASKMIMMWWKEVKINQWKNELGIGDCCPTPDKPAKQKRKSRKKAKRNADD